MSDVASTIVAPRRLRTQCGVADPSISEKVSSVSPEQFSLIRQTTSQFPRGLGKPRYVPKKNQLLLLWGTTGLLITKWPSRLHEKPIQTVDEILSQKGTNLPYTRDLVIAQINHNTGLVVEEDTIIIPNVLLEFGANDDLLDPIYPVICQVAFSQTFRMPGRRSRFS